MKLGVGAIFYLVALVIFLAVAFSVKVGGLDLLPLGLAALAAGLLFAGWGK